MMPSECDDMMLRNLLIIKPWMERNCRNNLPMLCAIITGCQTFRRNFWWIGRTSEAGILGEEN